MRKTAIDTESKQTVSSGVEWPDASDLRGRWLAIEVRQCGRCIGAMAARLHADNSADVVPRRIDADAASSVGTVLLEQLALQLARRHVRVATMYLPIQAAESHDWAIEAGFCRTHDLLVLARTVDSPDTSVRFGDWEFRAVGPTDQASLAPVFEGTLIESLDFPDVRTSAPVDGVLARFAEVGPSDTLMWYLVEHRGSPAGCLLMTARVDRACCELLYMGLVPEFRGIGGGRILAQYALWSAARLGLREVMVGVDAENDPAIASYAATGFDPVVQRHVLFRNLTGAEAVSRYAT